jgi:hypothetical protein
MQNMIIELVEVAERVWSVKEDEIDSDFLWSQRRKKHFAEACGFGEVESSVLHSEEK